MRCSLTTKRTISVRVAYHIVIKKKPTMAIEILPFWMWYHREHKLSKNFMKRRFYMNYSNGELFYSLEKNLSQEGLHHMLCLPGSVEQSAKQLFGGI